jgi:hypothetical protein
MYFISKRPARAKRGFSNIILCMYTKFDILGIIHVGKILITSQQDPNSVTGYDGFCISLKKKIENEQYQVPPKSD